jgi:exodeoxyribonuclease VII large subunit
MINKGKMRDTILSVSELTGSIKQILEENFSEVGIIGEISNFKAHVSGHWYFTLKDPGAQINCTMWKGVNSSVFFTPQDGMKVIASGRVTVYPPRGNYQLDVRSMKAAGLGELQAAFEKLKQKLAAEGLFDERFKKPIPPFPSKIGIVTAIDGAAFQDLKSVAERRYPLVELVIAPSKVQGEGAAADIAEKIKLLNREKGIDLIIIGRGGGSLEDLWAFNEEIVARAIFDSEIPVISAVGHQIDYTISDFVADLRAPTPTAAMELATPDKEELSALINEYSYSFPEKMLKILVNFSGEIERIITSYGFRMPQDAVRNKAQMLDNLLFRFQSNFDNRIAGSRNLLTLLESKIKSHSIDNILERGFSIVRQNEKIVSRKSQLIPESPVELKFYDGEIKIK